MEALDRAAWSAHPKRFTVRVSERETLGTSADLDLEIHERAGTALEKLRGR